MRFAETLVWSIWWETLPYVALASKVTDWYGLMCRLATSGVNLLSPGGTGDPGRLPPVVLVKGLDSETLWRSEKESTSRELPLGPASLPMMRCVSAYCTESCTMGRAGVSTMSKGMT